MGGTYSSEETQAQADGQKNVQIVAKPSALVVCGPSGCGQGNAHQEADGRFTSPVWLLLFPYNSGATARRGGKQSSRPPFKCRQILCRHTCAWRYSGNALSVDRCLVAQDGMHYNFTTKEDFEKGIEAGRFLEYARVHSNIYGTAYKVNP